MTKQIKYIKTPPDRVIDHHGRAIMDLIIDMVIQLGLKTDIFRDGKKEDRARRTSSKLLTRHKVT